MKQETATITPKESKDKSLSVGEKFILDCQYEKQGGFFSLLTKAMARADTKNLAKLELGFPEEVEALRNYRNIKSWWPNLVVKAISLGWKPLS